MSVANVRIESTGAYLPQKILTNHDLERLVDTSDEWITTRTGIKERHIAAENEATSDIALEAAKNALAKAGMSAEELDLIVVGTVTPDMFFPSTACQVQYKLGAKNAAGIDLNAACSGYIYSLVTVSQFLQNGNYENILIIGAEKLTSMIDWEDRGTCVIFADGAGASIVKPSDGSSKLLAFDLGVDGSYGDQLNVPAGGSRMPASEETVRNRLHYIKMNGNAIFKIAVNKMRETFQISMKKAGVSAEDITLVIPHQANLRIIEALRNFLELPREKVFVNIHKYGNTSAASIPIAFAEAVDQGVVKRGDIVGFAAFGGGLTWASAIIQY
jgi:3-oxoacyl-[acyl-carrier-protein] synthase-3